jgi:hypothetical protein
MKKDWVTVRWDDGQKPYERPLYCSFRELRFL